MSNNSNIPAEWNGTPTNYSAFDGFRRAGIFGKIMYVVAFPIVAPMMEAYRWNQSRNARNDAEEALIQAGSSFLHPSMLSAYNGIDGQVLSQAQAAAAQGRQAMSAPYDAGSAPAIGSGGRYR